MFWAISLITLIADQLIKLAIDRSMTVGTSIPIISNFLKLTYVRNTGAAFSLFTGFSPYLAVIGLIVTLFVIYYHFKIPKNDYWLQTALAFILGGSFGNLFDRFARGYVIDYVDFGFWPVFNLADSMIDVGIFMIVLAMVFRPEKKGG